MSMKTYRVTVEYRGRVTEVVEADSELDAEKKALDQAQDSINANLNIHNITTRDLSSS